MDIWNLVTNIATSQFGTLSKNTFLGSILVQLQESYKVSDLENMLIRNKLFTSNIYIKYVNVPLSQQNEANY